MWALLPLAAVTAKQSDCVLNIAPHKRPLTPGQKLALPQQTANGFLAVQKSPASLSAKANDENSGHSRGRAPRDLLTLKLLAAHRELARRQHGSKRLQS
jgi:hypothetical protein